MIKFSYATLQNIFKAITNYDINTCTSYINFRNPMIFLRLLKLKEGHNKTDT